MKHFMWVRVWILVVWVAGCGINTEPIMGTDQDAGITGQGSDASDDEFDGEATPEARFGSCVSDFDCLDVGYCDFDGGACVVADCGLSAQDEACDADYVACPLGQRSACGGACVDLRTCGEDGLNDDLALWGASRTAVCEEMPGTRVNIGKVVDECAPGENYLWFVLPEASAIRETIELDTFFCAGDDCVGLESGRVQVLFANDERIVGWMAATLPDGTVIDAAFEDGACGVVACE